MGEDAGATGEADEPSQGKWSDGFELRLLPGRK